MTNSSRGQCVGRVRAKRCQRNRTHILLYYCRCNSNASTRAMHFVSAASKLDQRYAGFASDSACRSIRRRRLATQAMRPIPNSRWMQHQSRFIAPVHRIKLCLQASLDESRRLQMLSFKDVLGIARLRSHNSPRRYTKSYINHPERQVQEKDVN